MHHMQNKKPLPLRPTTTYPAVVGRILVLARESVGVPQAELAAAAGVSQSTWSRIENGSSGLSIEQLSLAAAKLRCTPGHLVAEADRAVNGLAAQGVFVNAQRLDANAAPAPAVIGAMALGMLIVALLANK